MSRGVPRQGGLGGSKARVSSSSQCQCKVKEGRICSGKTSTHPVMSLTILASDSSIALALAWKSFSIMDVNVHMYVGGGRGVSVLVKGVLMPMLPCMPLPLQRQRMGVPKPCASFSPTGGSLFDEDPLSQPPA